MSIKKEVYDIIVKPTLTIILVPIIASFISQITTGNWFEIFNYIPGYVWVIISIALVIWIIIRWMKNKMEYAGSPYESFPRNGWKKIGEEFYDDVWWFIQIPRRDELVEGLEGLSHRYYRYSHSSIPYINVETPPRCPVCKTKLEIIKHYLWYTWKCVNCGFKIRKLDSQYKLGDHVEKIVSRKIEAEIEEMEINQGYKR